MSDWQKLNVAERRRQSPRVAVSTVAFALRPPAHARAHAKDEEQGLWLPLVRRVRAPFKDAWALPGGPTAWNQTLTQTAHATLVAATRIEPSYLEQLYSFGSIERSADAERLVTIAYWAQYSARDAAGTAAAAGEGANVAWFRADALPDLAFDHGEIIATALKRLRSRTAYAAVAHRFLDPEFTLAQLREVHEIILGHPLDPANFRRQMLASKTLEETGHSLAGVKHRPAKTYRYRPEED